MPGTTCVTDPQLGKYFIQQRRLRDYMPAADGKANPMCWWAWRWMSEDENETSREWLAGPLDTRRELDAAIERFRSAA